MPRYPRNHSSIPDRWMDYSPVGKNIEGTRFICFKVPLSPSVINDVEEKDRLDYDTLLNTVPNLGLIIDLTDTYRYYDPQVFESKGLSYKKLRIPGKTVPQPDLVEMFKRHVQDYLKTNANNDKLIGVHCTHGVNRTGYLVCNYMISVMTLSAEDAIKKFNAARGHKIERENYLQALRDIKPYRNERKHQRNWRRSNVHDKRDVSSNMRYSEYFRRENPVNDYEDRWNASSNWRKRSHNSSQNFNFTRSKQSHNYNAPNNAGYSQRTRLAYQNYDNTPSGSDDRNSYSRYNWRSKNRDERTWYRNN